MRFFGFGGGDDNDAAKLRRDASAQSLEQGGLPLNAIDRLREQVSRQGTPGHIFTSDLSVNELVLVRQAGYEPLGQVMGSSVYHVGWQYMPSGYWSNWGGSSGELTVLTEAFYHARHLAIGRLQQEAALLGATGVVGVRLERNEYEWGAGMLEFAAVGTAIREIDHPPGAPPDAAPFVSDLSGEEFWVLRQSGFRPVGFVVGNCSYYCVPNWTTQNATTGGFFGGAWQNQELKDYTQSLYTARSLAMGRMEKEASALGAVGVVGADVDVDAEPREIEVNNRTRIDMLYHFTAIGTAIAPYTGRWPLFAVKNAVSLK
jgi:uncharacterized protein YbjQ (UPF0145 family)